MKFLSLFAGIGGLDLGLERAGWECIGQVEIDPFATAVLAKHWPAVRRWSDVREITAGDVVGAVGRPDAIVGGFPCQPWSVAGKQRGADDPRHLWPEYYRLVCDLRPRWVLGENVPGLLSKGADAVLADLEAAGYTCWPIVLGANDVGAPHRRKRVFFVAQLADAYSMGTAREFGNVASQTRGSQSQSPKREWIWGAVGHGRADVADTDAKRELQSQGLVADIGRRFGDGRADVADADNAGRQERGGSIAVEHEQLAAQCGSSGWPGWPAKPGRPQHAWEEPRATEPEMGGAVDGVPRRLAGWRTGALKGLGNAVVPQVAEAIGWAIMEVDCE